LKKEIRYCSDRHCDKTGLDGGKDFEFDPKTPLCRHDDAGGTTYCSTQLEFYGCPRGFSED
jgi:hypothetical protein